VTGRELPFLEQWYAAQCDGDWEHEFGVRVDTLDNPGWSLSIELVGTVPEGVTAARRVVERTKSDWLTTWSNGRKFEARCGPLNLAEAIRAFAGFAAPSPKPK
jgi:hypothetical protein